MLVWKVSLTRFPTGCGPSRAAFQVGTLAAYNELATQAVWSFGPDTGFIGGLPPEITTLPKALKDYAQSIGEDYATSYSGKWGLQGATWTNSPMGAGYVSSDPRSMSSFCDLSHLIGLTYSNKYL